MSYQRAYITNVTLMVSFSLLVSGCLTGGADGGFSDLVSGSIEDVDELTITSTVPDVTSTTIEIGQTQNFFISAKAPTGRTITYTWALDSAVVGGGVGAYSITATSGNVGNKTLVVSVSDGVSTKSKSWSVKINGPPTLTAVTSGTPKVSVGSTVSVTISASDPNNDTLTYSWKLNGVSSSYITDGAATTAVTGNSSIVGANNLTVTVSDGSATASNTWTVEVNHFPSACNSLTNGKICTYSGSPSLGDNTNPTNSDYDLKITPIAQTQDSIGNFFIADWGNNIVWYWNRTANAVSRCGVSIPANTIKVVAGTGEAATGADGIALQSGVNGPRGLYYSDSTQRLYISEWNSSRVRYVDSSGFIYTGMGGGASNTDGAAAYAHACSNPAGLAYSSGLDAIFVACRNGHRVKRWDLSTDTAVTVLGTGGGGWGTFPGNPTTQQAARPYGLFLTADGLYTTHREVHRVTFLNLSGSSKTFWSSTTPVTINSGQAGVIIGTGTSGTSDDVAPGAANIGEPTALVVSGTTVYLVMTSGNNDRLYAANNSGASIVVGSTTVNAGKIKRVSPAAAGYNGSGLNLISAQINEPYDLTIDNQNANHIVFSDYNNRRLRYFDVGGGKTYDHIGSGKSRYGFYGDVSKPTLEHLFQYITGVVFDSTNRILFFADSQNCRIRKTDAYGRIETAVARGCGTPTVDNDVPSNAFAQISLTINDNDHTGLTLLPDNSLMMSNNKAHNMRIWNRTASDATYFDSYIQNDRISNVVGDYNTQGNGASGTAALSIALNRPSHAARDPSTGDMFIADTANHCIRTLTTAGVVNNTYGTCGTSGNAGSDIALASLTFNRPTSIVVDSLGNLIVTDRENHKVRYLNRSGSAVTIGSININAGRSVTIACLNGATGSNTENILASSAACNRPTSVVVNSDYICFTNMYSHNVRCITLTGSNAGRINTVAGYPQASVRAGSPYGFEQEGISGTSATLYYPSGLAFDSSGDLYISDTYNHIVRKLKLSAD